jgi:cytochrome c553
MRGKLTGRKHLAKPPAPACSGIAGHERVSCQSCHSPWVTACASCHTQWDGNGERTDALTGRVARGAWVEYDGRPRMDAPALGVLSRGGEPSVEPAAPGMIMTLNPPRAPSPRELPATAGSLLGPATRFVRAYALAVPHTTTRAGRSCASCHLDPFALGYGYGELSLASKEGSSAWRFQPTYAPSRIDGLPADAWIPFLSAEGASGGVATRTAFAPLARDAQRRTLAVGACLECHDPRTPAGRAMYLKFRESVTRAGPRCRVPAP